jgi:chromosome partitioning protein
MPIISAFCKKGGVGKTTFIGYLAQYYSQQGKTVLIISADDQNSVFKIFGAEKYVSAKNDDFLEFLLTGEKKKEDIVFEARPGMYLIKTLNTDILSLNITLKRAEEKKFRSVIEDFRQYFDYIFVDFPPSSSRLSEILLDISDTILLVVGLDTLGLQGYSNTIQYFVDSDIDLDKIRYIIPIGYHPIKNAPKKCLKELEKQAKTLTPKAQISIPIKDKSEIKNLQYEGVSVFDDYAMKDRFHQKNRDEIKKDLITVFKGLDL